MRVTFVWNLLPAIYPPCPKSQRQRGSWLSKSRKVAKRREADVRRRCSSHCLGSWHTPNMFFYECSPCGCQHYDTLFRKAVGPDPHLGFQRYTSRSWYEEGRLSLRLLHLGLQHFRHFSHATKFVCVRNPTLVSFVQELCLFSQWRKKKRLLITQSY